MSTATSCAILGVTVQPAPTFWSGVGWIYFRERSVPVSLKPATTVEQQIEILRGRGMVVDQALAEQWLTNVSYYRLSAYWYPARSLDPVQDDETFVPGTSFADAASLYEADRKLRTLVHDGMERIEVALRTRVGAVLCVSDPLAYENPVNFRPDFDHAAWMRTAQSRIERSQKRNEAIKHYTANYGQQYPFWVLAEVLDFSDVSRLYEGLPAEMQRSIAEGLGITIDYSALARPKRRAALANPPLARWLEQLSVVRNTCAHHARLWNKSFAPAPTNALRTVPPLSALPPGQSERVFGVLTVMSHLLRVISPGTTWPDNLASLIDTSFAPNPIVWVESLGIPDEWDGTF